MGGRKEGKKEGREERRKGGKKAVFAFFNLGHMSIFVKLNDSNFFQPA
jgi:hypothetical protein